MPDPAPNNSDGKNSERDMLLFAAVCIAAAGAALLLVFALVYFGK